MKILTARQIREWDEYTILHEPITSTELMERAAGKCFDWLKEKGYLNKSFMVFCGKGNNGGDGLVLARLLAESCCNVSVFILELGQLGTKDFQTNLEKIYRYKNIPLHFIREESDFPVTEKGTLLIDALFGTGISRPIEGTTARLIEYLNHSNCEIISIDLPSGMPADQSCIGWPVVHATYTLSFQCYKPALLVSENACAVGQVSILDIGLHRNFLNTLHSPFELTDKNKIADLYLPRNPFSHKGDFGHALLIAGSYGKMGAAVLAAKACLRSGVGLLTCLVPACGYNIVQTSVPEAMLITDANAACVSNPPEEMSKYDSIGIGPGIGTATETRKALKKILASVEKPIVIDADAINCLAMEKNIPLLPDGSILTPHPREFERLFGKSENDFHRIELAMAMAKKFHCVIVLKGHHTLIATPGGKGYFNSTGNAGMATAGSGDVLTGILTGLLAKGINSENAAILGVYLHGLAGDKAANHYSQEAMTAGDIIDFTSAAFKELADY